MNDRLDKLADEFEIRNLVARLAHLADRAPDLEEYLDCFTEDAIWEVSPESLAKITAPVSRPHLVGRAAIEADRLHVREIKHQGPGAETFHANTTLAVRVGDDGTAEAESYWLFIDAKFEPAIKRIGHYHDRFQRTDNGWRLARRVVTPS